MLSQTLRYLDDGSIELIEQEIGDPQPGEVQLSGGACGICSWDIATARYGKEMHPKAPAGHEGVGYVAKVGKGVTNLREGDRVAGGGFATVRNLAAERVYKVPDSPLADEFWIVEPVSCAVTGLDHCRLQPGQRVALIGCGFMGQLILQGLLHAPLAELVVIDIADNRLALAAKQGATETINSAQVDRAELVASLKARNFDVVVDTTGSQPALDLATDIVRRGGLINLFGWIKGSSATFDPTKWHLVGFSLVNSSPSSRLRDPFPPAIDLIHNGIFDLRPLVTHTVPLADYPDLMAEILSGGGGYVKGVVTLGE
jgi:threonine dehydrogenase-like Zn-dependent dehydrogenase